MIVPTILGELLVDPDPAKGRRAMKAMLQMKKINTMACGRQRQGNDRWCSLVLWQEMSARGRRHL